MEETAYLSHHGIKGMKWGVWNDETRRKRTGGKRSKAASDIRKGMEKVTSSDPYRIARGALNMSETALTGKAVAQALLGKQAVSSLSIAGIAVASDPVLAGSALAAGLLIGVGGIGVKKIKSMRS